MEDAADTPKPDGAKLAAEGAKWLERIRAAEKREEQWRKDAKSAEKAFTNDSKGDEGKCYDFNILHSNVETIVPAIYNSTPIPDIRPRWIEAIGEAPKPSQPQQGEDPRAAVAQFEQAMQAYQAKELRDKDAKSYGDMIERVITTQIDDNRLDTEIEQVAQDAFLSGRGIVRVKFTAIFNGDVPTNESLPVEAVSWRDYRQGPAKRWKDVPWVSYRHTASRETLEAKVIDKELFESQAGADVPTTGPENDSDDIPYWEIWDKESKRALFVREHDGRIMSMKPDPLELAGFFPMPPPVQPITLTGNMTPVCPFTIYKSLADELDTITKRINKIMKGLKVRGLIAGNASKLLSLSEADDNEIRIEEDLEGLAQTGGLENAVMWWPVDKAILVLKELHAQRDIVKASIYEITGISDIVRGASNANETLGAQEIKTRWGALRIQKMQRLIERQVRDIFGIMAELVSTKFSEPTLYQMTGIEMTDGMRALMQQPVLASYRVDVESDSTVRADLTRQKEDMTEFLAGTGNFFATMAPLIEQSPAMAEPVAEIYASMARVFKLGREAEDALDRMKSLAKQAAANPPPDPEAQKAEAEMAMQEKEAAAKQAERDQEMAHKREIHALTMKEKAFDAKAKRQAANADQNKTRVESGLEPIPEQETVDADELLKVMAAGQQQMAQAIQMLAQAMMAPKRVVKGPDGRPAGVETVLQ